MTMEYSHLSNKCGECVKVAKLLTWRSEFYFENSINAEGAKTFLKNKDVVFFFQISISVEGGVSI